MCPQNDLLRVKTVFNVASILDNYELIPNDHWTQVWLCDVPGKNFTQILFYCWHCSVINKITPLIALLSSYKNCQLCSHVATVGNVIFLVMTLVAI